MMLLYIIIAMQLQLSTQKHAPNYMRNIRAKQAVKAYKTQSTLVTIAKVPGGTRLQNS